MDVPTQSAANALGVFATAGAPAFYGTLVEAFALRWDTVILTGNFVLLLASVLFTAAVSRRLIRRAAP